MRDVSATRVLCNPTPTGDARAPDLQHAFIAVLKEIRGRQSQTQFAADCGLHRSHVSLMEAGKELPGLRTFQQIADGAGISMSELMRWIESRMTPALTERRPQRVSHR
jgi:transcriptional regulator with XRE-family HTH domain